MRNILYLFILFTLLNSCNYLIPKTKLGDLQGNTILETPSNWIKNSEDVEAGDIVVLEAWVLDDYLCDHRDTSYSILPFKDSIGQIISYQRTNVTETVVTHGNAPDDNHTCYEWYYYQTAIVRRN